MSFSQSAATNFVPLLARLVLAACFIPAGYHKVMDTTDFSGDDAKRLRELSVVATAESSPTFHLVSLMQEKPATPPSTAAPTGKPTSDESPKPAATGTPPTASGEPVKARALHQLTVMLHKAGWQYPWQMAWLAALTELVGGILILVGLFSRLWALGLASVMSVAFYLTTMTAYQDSLGFFKTFPPEDFGRFAGQAALFVLAFGVALTGAGSLSFDRMMFRGPSANGNGGGKKTAAE